MNQNVPGPVAIGGYTPTKTGTWSLIKPVLKGKCSFCLLCWIYCPDAAIRQEEGDELGFDYDLCKGCGICARECPLKAIEMVEFPSEGREGVH